jgi:endonuclease G, mitochondrial
MHDRLFRIFLLALTIGLLSGAADAHNKEPSCTWKGVTEGRLDASDAQLYRDGDAQIQNAVGKHLPFGFPLNAGDKHGEKLLAQEHYIVWYDSDLRAPLWTAHLLTKEDVAKKLTRADSFRSDPRLADSDRSECVDYNEPIFDQGHMVPNGDMTRSPTAMDATFLMSNMTPQHCAFNRRVWQVLEQRIRAWASAADKTWVITGAIFDRKAPIGRDPDEDAWRMNGKKGRRVAIPSAQYKIVIRENAGGYETLSIMLPNNNTLQTQTAIPKYIAGHITTLATIAQRSGFKFLESSQVTEDAALWPTAKKWARPLSANCKSSYPDK